MAVTIEHKFQIWLKKTKSINLYPTGKTNLMIIICNLKIQSIFIYILTGIYIYIYIYIYIHHTHYIYIYIYIYIYAINKYTLTHRLCKFV